MLSEMLFSTIMPMFIPGVETISHFFDLISDLFRDSIANYCNGNYLGYMRPAY